MCLLFLLNKIYKYFTVKNTEKQAQILREIHKFQVSFTTQTKTIHTLVDLKKSSPIIISKYSTIYFFYFLLTIFFLLPLTILLF